MKAVMNKIMG